MSVIAVAAIVGVSSQIAKGGVAHPHHLTTP
jgi:hypothetical protein